MLANCTGQPGRTASRGTDLQPDWLGVPAPALPGCGLGQLTCPRLASVSPAVIRPAAEPGSGMQADARFGACTR